MQDNPILAQRVRMRREELHLTIQDACERAMVTVRTWKHFEETGRIRANYETSVCRALQWRRLPTSLGDSINAPDWDRYRQCIREHAWSPFLADCYGERAALSFSTGSDLLRSDLLRDAYDLREAHLTDLSALPHSQLLPQLPAAFRERYGLDLVEQMLACLDTLCEKAHIGHPFYPDSILQELCVYLCVQKSAVLQSEPDFLRCFGSKREYTSWDAWTADFFGDDELQQYLYPDQPLELSRENPFHFDHWMD